MDETVTIPVLEEPVVSPSPTPIIIVSESENEQYYFQTCENINSFIGTVTPVVNFAAGFMQFLIVALACFAFYKLLRVFF